jgi:hypothetical protein
LQDASGTVISDSALNHASIAELEFWIIFVITNKRVNGFVGKK